MNRPLAPRGGNDKVYTPDDVAAKIVAHFMPSGRCLEPCVGHGAFSRFMPNCDWFETDLGKDFLTAPTESRWDWIVTNPPWSQFRAFLNKSMQVADNVVFLSLVNAFFMRARVDDMKHADFGLVEIVYIDTPPKPWPQTGFQLGATHIRRGHVGLTKITNQ